MAYDYKHKVKKLPTMEEYVNMCETEWDEEHPNGDGDHENPIEARKSRRANWAFEWSMMKATEEEHAAEAMAKVDAIKKECAARIKKVLYGENLEQTSTEKELLEMLNDLDINDGGTGSFSVPTASTGFGAAAEDQHKTSNAAILEMLKEMSGNK